MKAVLSGLLMAGLALGQAIPQAGREQLQDAYRNWRQSDPPLERDATSAGATLGARADKVAAEAARYFAARKIYLDSLATDAGQKAFALGPLSVAPDAPRGGEAFLGSQNTLLGTSIAAIARDPDPAIKRLLQALERERAAIGAVDSAVKGVQKTQEAVTQASVSAEQERAQISERYQKLATSLQQSAQLAAQTGVAWANYYRMLSDAARSVAAPVTSSVPGRSAASTVAITNPAPGAATRGVTAIPLSRYVGAWAYPTVGPRYHGAQPASVEMVVEEKGGRASGTLHATFKLLAGDARNPEIRFAFEGAFENSRTQKFAVTTSNGARGTLELIPGPAFNLLEVNFDSDEKPGAIRQANFLLIKK